MLPPYTHRLTQLNAGSIAAWLHSVLGPITAGSFFAILQSAGAGGLGLAFVNMLVQASAATLVGGMVANAVKNTICSSAGLVAVTERLYNVRGRMVAEGTATRVQEIDEPGKTEKNE